MIHYQLQCQSDHVFDGWFNDSASFDRQSKAGLIECPVCSSVQVRRALMAPALARGKRPERNQAATEDIARASTPLGDRDASPGASPSVGALALPDMPEKLRSLLQHLRSEVEKHCDYVGTQFADEARRIHYGEKEARGIYGETTPAEAEALTEEGIEIGVMPWLRRPDS